MAQVHIAADLSAQYFSVNVKPTASMPSFKSISSLLGKHSKMTTLWLSVQCSLPRLSLPSSKSVEVSCFSSSLLFTPPSQYFCASWYSERSRPHHALTCFIQEQPRGHSQLGWASWQALEVATKIFREILIIKHNSRRRPEF